jgi:hypothetical protein
MAKSADTPVVTPPAKADPDWKKRVDRALRARELGQNLRRGKPQSFRRAVGRAAK